MTIEIKRNTEETIIELVGRLVNTTAPALDKTINDDIEVILFHDYSYATLDALPETIEYLKEQNYVLLPLFYESQMVNK